MQTQPYFPKLIRKQKKMIYRQHKVVKGKANYPSL